MTRLSAIIPTRDRPDFLADCLASLQGQAFTDFEIVVVDDGSTCDLETVVGQSTGPVPIRFVRQEPSGLNVGRNTGAATARGEILAFLDDDTFVDPSWSAGVLDAFSLSGCDGLAGRIRLEFEGPVPRWLGAPLRHYLAELDLGPEPCWLPEDLVPYGANCAVTRSTLDALGGFRSGLDRIGTSLVSNGDVEFFLGVRRRGGQIAYWPDAGVRHRVPPHRLTREFFRRRAHAQGISDILLDDAGSASWAREIARAARAAPILAKNVATGRGAFSAVLWLDYCHGRVSGRRDLRKAA